jgi:hypothetical protein
MCHFSRDYLDRPLEFPAGGGVRKQHNTNEEITMKTDRTLFAWLLTAVGRLALVWLTGLLPLAGRAQPVVYVGINAAGSNELRVLNSDGTGDRAVPVALPEVLSPSCSKDGRFMALTSQTPGLPFAFSKNVFLLSLLTNELTQITQFADVTTFTNYFYHRPLYHALSPGATTIAVWDFVESLNATTPTLRTYSVPSDGFPLNTLAVSPFSEPLAGGQGVDWHPTLDLLVFAVDMETNQLDWDTGLWTGQYQPVTALFVAPSSGVPVQPLTFPVAYRRISLPYTWLYNMMDYAPVFSPNGQQVAYMRAIMVTVVPGGPQPWYVYLRIMNLDGSNDYTVTSSFPQWFYVSHVSWSRDGTKLVFDGGAQIFRNGVPINDLDPTTDALYIVNTNGTDGQLLRAPAAGFPVWTPAGTTFCNLPGVVVPGGVPGSGTIDDCGLPIHLSASRMPAGQFHLSISGGMTNLLYRVLASSNCAAWQPIGALPWTGPTSVFTDTGCTNLRRRFYRVVLGGN